MLCLCILASWNFLRSIVKQLTYHVCKYINFTNSVVSRFSFNMMMYYLVFGRKFVLGEFRWYWLLVSIYCCVSRVSKPFSFWPESKQALTVHIYIHKYFSAFYCMTCLHSFIGFQTCSRIQQSNIYQGLAEFDCREASSSFESQRSFTQRKKGKFWDKIMFALVYLTTIPFLDLSTYNNSLLCGTISSYSLLALQEISLQGYFIKLERIWQFKYF